MKYMIMLYGSQQDYDVLAGKPTDKPPMSREQAAAMHASLRWPKSATTGCPG